MKRFLTVCAAICICMSALADEGMWLPALISQRIDDMHDKGFTLSAEDIYSVNQASLKDAVVLFGGGCTGELVSAEGLLLTNHHCGYSYIQKHSSVEHDYLKDGFWAMRRSEELPNPGLYVRFLDHMEDVTSIILKGWEPGMSEEQRQSIVNTNSKELIVRATAEGNGLKATVEALYYGNQYYLFVYRQFDDVRLVGAPPSSIGKFGGDTDNWMWPRHTGDFSIFRIYADKDNNPAQYSDSNVPYRPRRHFRIAASGVREGDFTFIYGFPGSTKEYIHSDEARYVSEVSDPAKIALRTLRLDIQRKYMKQSQTVRIQYSAKNASVSNAWKKWQGESAGIVRMKTVENKRDYEKRFEGWAAGTRFEGITVRIAALLRELEPYMFAYEYFNETAGTSEIGKVAFNYVNNPQESTLDAFYKDYYLPIDKESFIAVMKEFDRNLGDDIKPEYFRKTLARYGSVEKWAEHIFTKSQFVSRAKVKDPGIKDPAYEFYSNMLSWFNDDIKPQVIRIRRELNLAYRDYMQGQMEFEPQRCFYPDANLTLRVAYGKVAGYEPVDAVWYDPVSTLKGIIQKDNPEIFDYNIPQALRDIYAAGGVEDQPVCFLATNHTTGGNSGSPVINADGNLVGINFDRVWEGTMSDIVYDPEICRNISLDIRYLLFLIKEIGHADHLLDEMEFCQN